jgi:transmembrane sensor
MNNLTEFYHLASQVLSGEANELEKQKIVNYLQKPQYRKVFNQLQLTYATKTEWPSQNHFNANKAWMRFKFELNKKTNPHINQKNPKRKNFWLYAASVLLIISFASTLFFITAKNHQDTIQPIIYQTLAGETLHITLHDKTSVHLNALSSLTVDKSFGKKRRAVTLTGEAYFDVAHNTNKPFIVTTQELCITVVGTAFNVKSYANESHFVAVSKGKVKVKLTNYTSPTILVAEGQAVTTSPDRSGLIAIPNPIGNPNDWGNGILQFDQMSINEAINLLHRTFGKQIFCLDSNLLSRKVRGTYHNENLISIISDWQFLLGFEYKVHPNGDLTLFSSTHNK